MQPFTAQLTPGIESKLVNLIQKLANGSKKSDAFGTFTPVCYDTAWVAMVTKPVSGREQLIFPKCFDYLLRNQNESGGWGETRWPIDALLNSLAALLCFVKSKQTGVTLRITPTELDERIQRAKAFVSKALQEWDVESSVHVGFEILVPALLQYLSNHGVDFDFPGRELLMKLNAKKLAKFDARFLYTKHMTTLVHSLEAFIGVVDFDKVRHHLRNGAMLGSPAATAVYLMKSSQWDESAESYLNRVSTYSLEEGGIPSAFPSPVFEGSWALSAFLSSGIDLDFLLSRGAQDIVDHLEQTLKMQKGVVGFAEDMLPDADDTAKCLQVLSQIQTTVGPESMISEFTSSDCFRTFRLETSPSFSANCNVLLALLAQEDASTYIADIAKAASFLIDAWETGPVSDKWNMSPVYSSMLFSQIIVTLITKWDEGKLDMWMDDMVQRRLAIITVDIIRQLLPKQRDDGSWAHCAEHTAYAVLSLANLLRLPVDSKLRDSMIAAVGRGRTYLQNNIDTWDQPEYIWVEKVSYGSPVLSESYCIAAMISSTTKRSWTERATSLFTVPSAFEQKLTGLCQLLPLTKDLSSQELRLPIVQSYYYLQRLHRDMPQLFPDFKPHENKYLPIVPFTWTVSSDKHDRSLSGKIMWEMIRFSVMMFQADEYMESTAADLSSTHLNILEDIIRQRCGCADTWVRSNDQSSDKHQCLAKENLQDELNNLETSESHDSGYSPTKDFKTLGFGAVAQVVDEVISHILNQPSLANANEALRRQVSHELCGFLLAHIHHIRDNSLFSQQESPIAENIKCFSNPGITYHDWVHSVASDDTSCPFAFTYFCCLLNSANGYRLPDVESQYLAKSLCRHLAIMCRQYNDYGSLNRDLEEGNLNALNFPEFSPVVKVSKDMAKQKLMRLAEHERKCLNLTLEELKDVVEKPMYDAISTFVDVTDLYGQLYVVKDLAKRVK